MLLHINHHKALRWMSCKCLQQLFYKHNAVAKTLKKGSVKHLMFVTSKPASCPQTNSWLSRVEIKLLQPPLHHLHGDSMDYQSDASGDCFASSHTIWNRNAQTQMCTSCQRAYKPMYTYCTSIPLSCLEKFSLFPKTTSGQSIITCNSGNVL